MNRLFCMEFIMQKEAQIYVKNYGRIPIINGISEKIWKTWKRTVKTKQTFLYEKIIVILIDKMQYYFL